VSLALAAFPPDAGAEFPPDVGAVASLALPAGPPVVAAGVAPFGAEGSSAARA